MKPLNNLKLGRQNIRLTIKVHEIGRVEIRRRLDYALLAESHNLMVTSGLNLIAAGLAGTLVLAYTAIGTNSTAPVVGDTILGTEVKRLQITASSVLANVVTVQTFFLAADCTYHIREVGVFGSDSDGSNDSGTLFARSLIDYDNSSSPVDLIVTFGITLAIGA